MRALHLPGSILKNAGERKVQLGFLRAEERQANAGTQKGFTALTDSL